jgi:hypothetical protein
MKRVDDADDLANRAFGVFLLNASKYFTLDRFDDMTEDELLSLITFASDALKKRKVEDVYKSSRNYKEELVNALDLKWKEYVEDRFKKLPQDCPHREMLFTTTGSVRFVFFNHLDCNKAIITDEWNEFGNLLFLNWLKVLMEDIRKDFLVSKEYSDCEQSVLETTLTISEILILQVE